MAISRADPLQLNVPIVDAAGNPTALFLRQWNLVRTGTAAADHTHETLPGAGTVAGQLLYWSGGAWIPVDGLFWDAINKQLGIGGVPSRSLSVVAPDPRFKIAAGGFESSYFEQRITSTQALFEKLTAAGNAVIQFNPRPLDGTSLAEFIFFRTTNSLGDVRLSLRRGDGTNTNIHQIGVKSGGFVRLNEQQDDIDLIYHGQAFPNLLFGDAAAGSIGVGTSAMPATGNRCLVLGAGVDPGVIDPGTAVARAQLVAGVAEFVVIDGAGNAVQLTPHRYANHAADPDDTYPCQVITDQQYLGISREIDLTRMAKLLEQITGETLIHDAPIPARDWVSDQESLMRRYMDAYERWEHLVRAYEEKYSAWERLRDAFEPTAGTPEFIEDPPDHPGIPPEEFVVRDPPPWLRERLSATRRFDIGAMNVVRSRYKSWCAVKNIVSSDS